MFLPRSRRIAGCDAVHLHGQSRQGDRSKQRGISAQTSCQDVQAQGCHTTPGPNPSTITASQHCSVSGATLRMLPDLRDMLCAYRYALWCQVGTGPCLGSGERKEGGRNPRRGTPGERFVGWPNALYASRNRPPGGRRRRVLVYRSSSPPSFWPPPDLRTPPLSHSSSSSFFSSHAPFRKTLPRARVWVRVSTWDGYMTCRESFQTRCGRHPSS